MLDALPEVVSQYPDLVYLVLGATHPVIKKNFGEHTGNIFRIRSQNLDLKKM
jgi:hypothetical protein